EDIGLRILDVANAKRAGLAQREAEAGAAEVDGEYPRARKPLRGLDRVLAGAATGDQHVEAATRCGEPDRRGRELAPQVPFNRRRLTTRRRLEPARVGHRLVLALDLERYLVVDRRQRRDRLPDVAFLQGLAPFLIDQVTDCGLPSAHRPRVRDGD